MSSRLALSVTGTTGPAIALPAKTRLDVYEIEALIAQGGFALVYRAVHSATGKVVAIKEYFPEAIALRHAAHRVTARASNASARFEVGRRAFLDEARSLARFEHPSLVRVQGLFEANGTAYRVMPFTPGPTLLAHRLALGRMPAIEDFRRWVDGLVGAVAALHHAGCVHGAVSPANVLLRPDERPLLLGFDAVRNALAPAGRAGTGQALEEVRTTAERRAPSVRFAAGTAADLRALAATLRYCIEGSAPVGQSLADAWQREGGPVPIPQDIMRLLCAIDAFLSDQPGERPRGVAEFSRRLEDAGVAPPLRVAAAAMAQDEDRPAPARDGSLGSTAAASNARDTRADRMAAEHLGSAGDAWSEAAPPPEGNVGSGRAVEAETEAESDAKAETAANAEVETAANAEVETAANAEVETAANAEVETAANAEVEAAANAEVEAAAALTLEVAAEGPSDVESAVEPESRAKAHTDAGVESEVEVAADVEAKAEVDEAPGLAADKSAPTHSVVEVPCAPSMPGPIPTAPATDDPARRSPDEARIPGLSGPISTGHDTVASRAVRPRRMAAAVVVAASVVLAVGVTAWGYRQGESRPASQPQAPSDPHAIATLPADTSDLAPAAVPTPILVPMAAQEADSRPAAVLVAPAEAAPSVAPPKRSPSPPVAKVPAAPRKVVAGAAAKTKSPLEACEGRKGFALYQCTQLQCAKAASADHADCVSLR